MPAIEEVIDDVEVDEVLRTKSTLLASLSWNTGAIHFCPGFSASLTVDRVLQVRYFKELLQVKFNYMNVPQPLLAKVDKHDKTLFSSSAWTSSDGLQVQKFMGIQVSMNGTRSIVSSLPHGLAGVNGPWATRVFSALCGYHLMDVLALLGDEYPRPPVVERTQILECKLPVRFYFVLVYLTY